MNLENIVGDVVMNVVSNIVGASLGLKAINGKLKPKFSKNKILIQGLVILLLIGLIIGFIYFFINFNFEIMLIFLLITICFVYLILISPYFQNSNNFYIEFINDNTMEGFKLSYKNKLVKIDYIIDQEGKLAFKNNNSKINCVSYLDGSKMSNVTKYRIVNYFVKWLNDNNLMSEQITTTFE